MWQFSLKGRLGDVPLISEQDKLSPMSRNTTAHLSFPLLPLIYNIFFTEPKIFFKAISVCDIARISEKCDKEKYSRHGFTHQRMNSRVYIPGRCHLGRINHKDHEAQCGSPWMFHFFKFELRCLKGKCDGLEIEQVIYNTWRELANPISKVTLQKDLFSRERRCIKVSMLENSFCSRPLGKEM